MVKAFEEGRDRCEFFTGAQTVAAGLRVPKPLGDRLILRTLRESNGTAIAVSDDEMIAARARSPPPRESRRAWKARRRWPRCAS